MVDQEVTCVPNVPMCIGIGCLIWGILIRLGISKAWFTAFSIPRYSIRSMAFGAIPLSLAMFTLGLFMKIRFLGWIGEEAGSLSIDYTVFPLGALGLILAVWQPRWILPDWYRWLRDHHRDIMPQLRHEARQDKMWHTRVSTQEGLEQWAIEVRHRHWLKSRYAPDVVAFMLAEARLDDGWTERVSTETGLVAWAEEMAARYRERRQVKDP